MRRIICLLLLATSPVLAETFGLSSPGGSSGTMALWGTNYVTRSHKRTTYQYVASANDTWTEIWAYVDSTTDGPTSMAGALYRVDFISGDTAYPDSRLALTDTVDAIANNYHWERFNAKTDYVLSLLDSVTIAWYVGTNNVTSYYNSLTNGTAMYETDSDPLPEDITPPATQPYVWSVFGCINQEGGGAIDQGHVPTSYTGGTSWVTPENITGDEGRADFDDACAIDQSGDQNPLAATGFDFSLPTVQSVDSILVFVQANALTATGSRDEFNIGLSKDGSTVIQYFNDQPIVTTSADCGGAEADLSFMFRGDTLGTWSATEINTSLYVMIQDANKDPYAIRFDGMSATVYFTPQAEAGAETPRLDWLQAPYGAGKVHDVSDTTRIHNP